MMDFHICKYLVTFRTLGFLESMRIFFIRLYRSIRNSIKRMKIRFNSCQMSDEKFYKFLNFPCSNEKDLILYFTNRNDPKCFEKQKDEMICFFKNNFSNEAKKIINEADDILGHKIRIFGREYNFGEKIDWHYDPVTGKSWKKSYYSSYNYCGASRTGDIKYPWELNRHQYFITLGKAYWLTKDEKYAKEFTDQIISWINENPVEVGINWVSALEIAIRIISWVIGYHFFRHSAYFQKECMKDSVKYLFLQGRHLRENLSIDWPFRNNHIIGETCALCILSMLFPEFRPSRGWLDTSLRILYKEIKTQFYEDGVNREQSTAYHRFVLDFLFLVVLWASKSSVQIKDELRNQVEKMLNYQMYLVTPNGRFPSIGDDDGGRGIRISESRGFWDLRDWLAVGAVFFNRPDFKFVARAPCEEVFWLIGAEGIISFQEMKEEKPPKDSMAFLEGGHFIIRSDWDNEADYLFLRCGEFGLVGEGRCGHAHCDMLSFVLFKNGLPLIVDSGTFTYYGERTERDYFRQTGSHNIIKIDGVEQANPIGIFAWKNIPKGRLIAWGESDHQIEFVGECRIGKKFLHQRKVVFDKKRREWTIEDSVLMGKDPIKFQWIIHLAADAHLEKDGYSWVIFHPDQTRVFQIIPETYQEAVIQESWISYMYGGKKKNKKLIIAVEKNPFRIRIR